MFAKRRDDDVIPRFAPTQLDMLFRLPEKRDVPEFMCRLIEAVLTYIVVIYPSL
jgi:hypothetical protein